MYPNHQHLHGFTLIEVIVTMAILSVGLLGMAGLQVTGLKSTTGAGNRTQTTLLISDLAERLRANPTAVDNNLFLNVDEADIDCTTLPSPYCAEYHNGSSLVTAENCNPAQLAAFDLNTWFCGPSSDGQRVSGVDDLLPQATFSIICNDSDNSDADGCTNNSPHTLTIGWTEPNPNRSSADPTVSPSVSIVIQP